MSWCLGQESCPVPIPAPLFLLDPEFPDDPEATWIHAPRRALGLMQGKRIRRIEFEYGHDELDLLAWVYGAGVDASATWPALLDLLRSSAPGKNLSWSAPSNPNDAARKVLLPLAEYMNVCLTLDDDAAWDEGARILSSVHPRLLEWMTARAPACARFRSADVRKVTLAKASMYEHWALDAYHHTQGRIEVLGVQDQLRAEHLARLRAAANPVADAEMVGRLREQANLLSRMPIWRANAMAIQPGPVRAREGDSVFPAHMRIPPGREGPRISSGGRHDDPTPERAATEAEKRAFLALAPFALGFALGAAARVWQWARIAHQGYFYYKLQERVGPAAPEFSAGERDSNIVDQRSAMAHHVQVATSGTRGEAAAAASNAQAQSDSAPGRDIQETANRTIQADVAGPSAPVNVNDGDRNSGKPTQPEPAPQPPAGGETPPPKPAAKPDDDDLKPLGIELGCVSPHAEPEVRTLDMDHILRTIRLWTDWNTKIRDMERNGGSIESLIEAMHLNYLSLINFRPGHEQPSRMDPYLILAEIEARDARIITWPRPDSDLNLIRDLKKP